MSHAIAQGCESSSLEIKHNRGSLKNIAMDRHLGHSSYYNHSYHLVLFPYPSNHRIVLNQFHSVTNLYISKHVSFVYTAS